MPRKTGTTLAQAAGLDTCPCRFFISVDDRGFYFCAGFGSSEHKYHVPIQNGSGAMPMRFINPIEKAILISIAKANVSDGVSRNICYERNQVLLQRGQIRSLHKMSRRVVTNDESMEEGGDDFIEQFKKKGISFCLLYHHEEVDGSGRVNSQLINEINELPDDSMASGAGETSADCTTDRLLLDAQQHEDMAAFAVENRHLFDLVREQELLLGLAYVYPKEKRIFRLFPRVLKVDCTSGTNNEKRSLLTMTVIDQNGKSFIIFRALLPNERAWTFQWIFQDVLPNMLGEEYLREINVIITDGDSQETTQLDIAIASFFPNVMRLRCGWHIIDRGWNAHGPKSTAATKDKRDEWTIVLRVLQTWMYSWMRPECCESQEELDISKALFEAYVQKEVNCAVFLFLTNIILFLTN
jgi:hypothetical protein